MTELNDSIYARFERTVLENLEQKDRIAGYQQKIHDIRAEHKKAIKKVKGSCEAQLAEKDAIIAALKGELAHAAAVVSHNGTNTGIPTAATPIGKKKVIPNSRRSSGKKRGGQAGHEKHSLLQFKAEDVTETVRHATGGVCGSCGGVVIDSGESVVKDEFDVEIRTVKRRHEFQVCRCSKCGNEIRQPIPAKLKEANQYGGNVQAVALSLMNTGNVPINKASMFLSGVTGGELNLSEGYIAKLQSRAADRLTVFRDELKALLITRPVIHWDDTVIMMNTARACLRFYGDDTISFYAAHAHKDLDSLRADGVLGNLRGSNSVMHDHNKVNYNEIYFFQNLECNQHLQRDLQKNSDDTYHDWSVKFKELISVTIHERKMAAGDGENRFTQIYVEGFKRKAHSILEQAREEHKCVNKYAWNFERLLILRIEKYYCNFFAWLEDFSLPTTNNLSERGLRCIKSHMKISGQFQNVSTAQNYASIKTYIETCRKNSINEMLALMRLLTGEPFSVTEIFA
jgi:ribosomal protein L37AE/L43A